MSSRVCPSLASRLVNLSSSPSCGSCWAKASVAASARRIAERLRRAVISFAMHDAPTDDGVAHLGFQQVLRRDAADVAGEHHEIGELAHGDAALHLLLVRRPCGVDRAGADRLVDRDALLRMEAALRLSV